MEAAVQSQSIDELRAEFPKIPGDNPAERRVMVDQEIRKGLVADLARQEVTETQLSAWVQFAISAAKADLCGKNVPVALLTDIFDASSVERCESVFALVEENIAVWKSTSFFDACRNQLLRMCNDILRRISRTVKTELCGRILILLARLLPLTEKSGLNLMSQFNADNVTRFDAADESDELLPVGADSAGRSSAAADEMEVEEGEMFDNSTAPSSSTPIDYALYCKFWQLQKYFASPSSCYEKIEWRRLLHNTNDVMAVLNNYKLDDSSERAAKRRRFEDAAAPLSKKTKITVDDDERISEKLLAQRNSRKSIDGTSDEDAFFAKYLTSQKLLQLQLNDSQFRRYFLCQFLILFQYLGADLKYKDKKQVLTEEQTKWVEETTEQCYRLLKETYPDGQKFAKSVKHILRREEHWSDWKNSNCEDFTKSVDKERMQPFKKRVRPKFDPAKIDLGNSELTRLWNVDTDNLKACESQQRLFVPTLEEFLEEPIEQADPENLVEDKYKLVNDENFQWRAARLLWARNATHLLTALPNNNVATSMASYIESTLQKTAVEIPKFKKAMEEKKQRPTPTRPTPAEEDEAAKDDAAQPTVSEARLAELATLIGADWPKLAAQLGNSEESIAAYRKKHVPDEVAALLLAQFAEQGAPTVRRLRNLLLEAELFNEDVAAVLSKAETAESPPASQLPDAPTAAAATAAVAFAPATEATPLSTVAAPTAEKAAAAAALPPSPKKPKT